MSLLKTTHASSKAAQSAKLRRLGAVGNLRMARKGENAPRKYASGGAVDSGPVDGAPAKPRLDRPGRKMAGKGKGAKGTNVNVVIMQKPDGGGPKPDMPMPGPPPGAGPGGPPMPPPPMKAYGGAVGRYASGGRIANLGKYAHGGKVKRADGGKTVQDDSGTDESTQRAYLRKKASDERDDAGASIGKGATSAVIGGLLRSGNKALQNSSSLPARAIGKTLEYGNFGTAALHGAAAAGKASDAKRHDAEADKFEGKKSGGSVKKGKC